MLSKASLVCMSSVIRIVLPAYCNHRDYRAHQCIDRFDDLGRFLVDLLVLDDVDHFLIHRDAGNGLLLGLQLGLERVIEALVIVGLLDVVPDGLLDVAQVLLQCGICPIGEGYLVS